MRSDADRRHPLHDALCLYMADAEAASHLFRAFWPPTVKRTHCGVIRGDNRRWRRYGGGHARFEGTENHEEWTDFSATIEHPVHANRGRYHALIGHLDCYLFAERVCTFEGNVTPEDPYAAHRKIPPAPGSTWTPPPPPTSEPAEFFETVYRAIAVEVKARIGSLGDLLRQIQRYRTEWSGGDDETQAPAKWVVLSPSVNEPLRQMLATQDIVGIRPGSAFLPWCEHHGLRLPTDAIRMLSPQLALPDISSGPDLLTS